MNQWEQPWAFEGLTKTLESFNPKVHKECPKCQGFGRFKYRQNEPMLIYCWQCDGWGYVALNSIHATCIHNMVHHKNISNCYNQFICTKCGHKENVDSSG